MQPLQLNSKFEDESGRCNHFSYNKLLWPIVLILAMGTNSSCVSSNSESEEESHKKTVVSKDSINGGMAAVKVVENPVLTMLMADLNHIKTSEESQTYKLNALVSLNGKYEAEKTRLTDKEQTEFERSLSMTIYSLGGTNACSDHSYSGVFSSDQLPSNVEDVDEDDQTVYTRVEKTAQFPGGNKAMMEYIKRNIIYPYESKEAGMQGRVIVTFVINKDGTIEGGEVIRGVDTRLDAEALRVVRTIPYWIPAENNGKIVRSKYTIPVFFKLPN